MLDAKGAFIQLLNDSFNKLLLRLMVSLVRFGLVKVI